MLSDFSVVSALTPLSAEGAAAPLLSAGVLSAGGVLCVLSAEGVPVPLSAGGAVAPLLSAGVLSAGGVSAPSSAGGVL